MDDSILYHLYAVLNQIYHTAPRQKKGGAHSETASKHLILTPSQITKAISKQQNDRKGWIYT